MSLFFFCLLKTCFSEKFLNFIASYDVIDLPMKTLFNVVKKNLGVAQSLIYVVQFNQPNVEKELRLGSGDLDWEQWQVQEKIIQSPPVHCQAYLHEYDQVLLS